MFLSPLILEGGWFKTLFLKKFPQSYHPTLATGGNFTISGCEVGLLLKEKPNKEAIY